MYILSVKGKNGDEKYFFSVDNSSPHSIVTSRGLFSATMAYRIKGKSLFFRACMGGGGEVKAGWTSKEKAQIFLRYLGPST